MHLFPLPAVMPCAAVLCVSIALYIAASAGVGTVALLDVDVCVWESVAADQPDQS